MPKTENANLISISEVIELAKARGVDFGKGDPLNRLRYYAKNQLLPPSQRKSFNGKPPEGAYPDSVVESLVEIDRKLKEGRNIQTIIREAQAQKIFSVVGNEPEKPALPIEPIAEEARPIYSPAPVLKEETSEISSAKTSFGLDQKQLTNWSRIGLVAAVVMLGLGFLSFLILNHPSVSKGNKTTLPQIVPNVLGAASIEPFFYVNVDTNIKGGLSVSGGINTNNTDVDAGTGKITASNVLYSLTAGSNVNITGGQNPTISVGKIPADILGTSGKISITGSTTKTITIASSYSGQTTISTLGTVTTGVWQASPIGVSYLNAGSCGANQFVQAINGALTCGTDQTGAGTPVQIKVDNVNLQTADNLDFASSDFSVVSDGPNEVNLALATTAVTPGSYGSATQVSTFTVDTKGRLTAAASTAIALDAAAITSGTLPVTRGGTGAGTAAGARSNLGAAASGANTDITSLTLSGTITGATGISTSALTLSGFDCTANINGGKLTTNGSGVVSCADDISGAATPSFSSIATGTNTTATMTVGTGAILTVSGSGLIRATAFTGSGSTTDSIDLGSAEVSGTLPATSVGNGLTDAQVSNTLTVDATGSLSATAVNSGTLGNAGVTLALGSFASITGTLGDANVADNITASNYLPLVGGTLTGSLTLNDNDGVSGDVNLVLGDGNESGNIDTNGGTLTTGTVSVNGDSITDFTGTGLSVSGGALTNTGVISVSCTTITCSGTNPASFSVANGAIGNANLANFTINFTASSGALSVPASIDLGASGAFDIVLASGSGLEKASGLTLRTDCATNQVLKYNSGWGCANDSGTGSASDLQGAYDGGTGGITTASGKDVAITLPAGLGTPTSFSVTNSHTSASKALYVNNANASGTVTNGIFVEQTGAGTLSNGIQIKRTAGTLTTGLLFTGTFTNFIDSPASVFKVDNAGAVTGASFTGVGSGLTSLNASNITSGTLAVARGGTGTGSTPTNGQLLIGNGTDYTLATISGSNSLLVSNGAGSIALDTTLDSGSGLTKTSGLSLLRTCGTNEILKWNGSSWACATDNGTGSASDLQGAYDGGTGAITTSTAKDIAFNLADSATDSNFVVTTKDGSTSFSKFVREDGSGSADPAQLILLDNLDTTRAVPIGLKIQAAAGGITTALDVSDAEIVTGLALGSNDVTVGGVTIDSTEFARLDGKDAALVDINDAVATAITGTGTLTSGTLGAGFTTVAVARGGTGVTTFGGTNAILYTTTADNLSSIATGNNGALVTSSGGVPSITTSSANQVLRANGSGTVGFGSIDLSNSSTVGSSILPIANGGTNSTATPTAGAVAYGTGSAFAFTAQAASISQCLLSGNPVSSSPVWGSCGAGASGQTYTDGTNPVNNATSLTFDNFFTTSGTSPNAHVTITADSLDFTELKDALALDASTSIATANNKTLSVTSDLSGGARSTNVFSITQANDASNNSTGALLNISNSDTASSGALISLSQSGTGASILLPATNGTSGGLQFGSDANLVTLYRSANDTLKTDDSFTAAGSTITFSALSTAGVVTNTSSGVLGTLAGTTTTVLHGNASGLPTYGAVSLTADVSGTLPIANGGTNNNAAIGGAGAVIYSDGTKFAYGGTTGSANLCLLSGASGTGQPTWGSCGAGSSGATISDGTNTVTNVVTENFNNFFTVSPNGGTSTANITIKDDSLDFAQLADTLALDANLTLNQSASTWTQNFTGTTTTGLSYNANSLTTGKLANLSFTATTSGTGTTTGLQINTAASVANAAGTYTLNSLDLATPTDGSSTCSGASVTACRLNALTIGGFGLAQAKITSTALNITDQYNATGTHYGICFDCDGTYSNQQSANGLTWGNDANNVSLYRTGNNIVGTDKGFSVDNSNTASLIIGYGDFSSRNSLRFRNDSGNLDGGIYEANSEVLFIQAGDANNITFHDDSGADKVNFNLNAAANSDDRFTFGAGGVGNNDADFRLNAASGASAAAIIQFGSNGTYDTNLYRSAADTLKTDDAFNVNGNLNISSAGAITAATGVTSSGSITFSGLSTAGVVTNTSSGVLGTLAGTTTTVLHGNASGLPTYGAVSLTADVSGLLPTANGGLGANVTAATGGEVLYSTGTTTYGHLAAGGAGQCLLSGGTGAPNWSSCASGATSPFKSASGEITKDTAFVNDQVHLTAAQAADYGLKVDTSIANQSVDLFQVTNTGFGTNVDAVNLASFNLTTSAIAGTRTNSVVKIDATSGATEAADTLYGINFGAITGQTGTETAINVGTGWDNLLTSANVSLTAAGLFTTADDIAVNGGDLTTTATTFNLLSGATTALNVGPGGATASSINLAGGSGATGCTVAGDTGNLTCTGTITSSGGSAVGYWSRSGTTLSPATSGDVIDLGSIGTSSQAYKATATANTSIAGVLGLTVSSAINNNKGILLDYTASGGTNLTQIGADFKFTNSDTTFATDVYYATRITNAATAGTTPTTALLQLDNAENTASSVTAGIAFSNTGGTNASYDYGIDLSVANAFNVAALNLGANNVTGTTPTIDFTNFDLRGSLNGAGGSANHLVLSGTLGAFDGSDTFRGLYLNYTNANHTGTNNNFNAVDVGTISGDADANETALNIGAGWDAVLSSPLGGFGRMNENRLQYSEDFGASGFGATAWTKTNITFTADTTAAPDNNTTADTLTPTTGATANVEQQYNLAASLSGLTYTFSVWLKAGTAATSKIEIRDFTAGTSCGSSTPSATSTWTRFSVTCTFGGTNQIVAVRIYPDNSNSTGSVIAWGAQLEQNSTPSIYSATGNGIIKAFSNGVSVDGFLRTSSSVSIGAGASTFFAINGSGGYAGLNLTPVLTPFLAALAHGELISVNLASSAGSELSSLKIENPTLLNSATAAANYGIHILNQTVGTTNYGILIDGASTAGINLSSITLGSTGYLATLAGSNTGTTTGVGITTGTITSGTQNAFLATLTATSAGTLNGLNITPSGSFGATTVSGINIGTITDSGSTSTGIKIGTGWDTSILGTGALSISSTSGALALATVTSGAITLSPAGTLTADGVTISSTTVGASGILADITPTFNNSSGVATGAKISITDSTSSTGVYDGFLISSNSTSNVTSTSSSSNQSQKNLLRATSNFWATGGTVAQLDQMGNNEAYSQISWNSYFGEEFSKKRANVTASGNQNWGDTAEYNTDHMSSGGGGTCTISYRDNIVNGITRLDTGTSIGGIQGCNLYNGSNATGTAQDIFKAANKPVILMKVMPSTQTDSNHILQVGISDTITSGAADPTNGIWFTGDGTNTWAGKAKTGGSTSTATCPASNYSTTTFNLLKIVVESTSKVSYWVDKDPSDGISFVYCGSLTANIPTANLHQYFHAESGSTNQWTLDIDFVRIWQDDSISVDQSDTASQSTTTNPETTSPVPSQDTLHNTQEQIKALNRLTEDINKNLTATLSAGSKFQIMNSLNNVVASIDDVGNAIFHSIDVLIAKIQDLFIGNSITIKKDAKISGTATFASGETELVILSDKVKADSLIYLTAKSKTLGRNLYIKEIKPGESFTVGIENSSDPTAASPSASQNIEFNWLLVGQN